MADERKNGLDPAETAARHARQAAQLDAMVAKGTIPVGSRDNMGNSIETLINPLETSARNRAARLANAR
jgi:hypothetical protein